jgi:hypothetical protein
MPQNPDKYNRLRRNQKYTSTKRTIYAKQYPDKEYSANGYIKPIGVTKGKYYTLHVNSGATKYGLSPTSSTPLPIYAASWEDADYGENKSNNRPLSVYDKTKIKEKYDYDTYFSIVNMPTYLQRDINSRPHVFNRTSKEKNEHDGPLAVPSIEGIGSDEIGFIIFNKQIWPEYINTTEKPSEKFYNTKNEKIEYYLDTLVPEKIENKWVYSYHSIDSKYSLTSGNYKYNHSLGKLINNDDTQRAIEKTTTVGISSTVTDYATANGTINLFKIESRNEELQLDANGLPTKIISKYKEYIDPTKPSGINTDTQIIQDRHSAWRTVNEHYYDPTRVPLQLIDIYEEAQVAPESINTQINTNYYYGFISYKIYEAELYKILQPNHQSFRTPHDSYDDCDTFLACFDDRSYYFKSSNNYDTYRRNQDEYQDEYWEYPWEQWDDIVTDYIGRTEVIYKNENKLPLHMYGVTLEDVTYFYLKNSTLIPALLLTAGDDVFNSNFHGYFYPDATAADDFIAAAVAVARVYYYYAPPIEVGIIPQDKTEKCLSVKKTNIPSTTRFNVYNKKASDLLITHQLPPQYYYTHTRPYYVSRDTAEENKPENEKFMTPIELTDLSRETVEANQKKYSFKIVNPPNDSIFAVQKDLDIINDLKLIGHRSYFNSVTNKEHYIISDYQPENCNMNGYRNYLVNEAGVYYNVNWNIATHLTSIDDVKILHPNVIPETLVDTHLELEIASNGYISSITDFTNNFKITDLDKSTRTLQNSEVFSETLEQKKEKFKNFKPEYFFW